MKVVIIGAGVAGLSAGINLAKAGVEVEIVEKHSEAGGLCTGWTRRGKSGARYSFNGCMHWLLGARKGTPFHKYISELIDLEKINFIDHEERVEYEVEGRTFHFYSKVERFEEYLIGIAPEDEGVIREWMDAVRLVNSMQEMLPPDFEQPTVWGKVRYAIRMQRFARFVPFLMKWRGVTTSRFAERFKNEWLRKAVRGLYMTEMQMMHVIFVQSYADMGIASYPEGGSEKIARMLRESFERNGGVLRLNAEVEEIVVEKGEAKGVRLKSGEVVEGDCVVSAADWIWTQGKALGGRYVSKKQRELVLPKKERIYYSYCMVYLGVRSRMEGYAHFMRRDVEKFVLPDGTEFERIEIHIYNYDRELAKEGGCTICVDMQTQEGEYWIGLRERARGEYEKAKERIAREVVERLKGVFGEEFEGEIDVVDVTTPATYYRYTGNYNGSSQGWMPMENVMRRPPIGRKVKGLKRFYQVGHWTEAGGGLPIAVKSGRECAREIVGEIMVNG